MPTRLQDVHAAIEAFRREKLAVPATTAHEQWQEEKKLVTRYRQRELFELVQNALDRARKAVVVCSDPEAGFLAVGNDGTPVSIALEGGGRGDFRGFCSVNVSTKEAWEAIGNKGVGFKSVFGTARSAEVWSRHEDAGWWGFRVRHPFCAEHAVGEIAAYCAQLKNESAPSFYFPEPLDPDGCPWLALPWVEQHHLRTLVVLHQPDDASVHTRFLEFAETELCFVAARYTDRPNLEVHYLGAGGFPVSAPSAIDLPAGYVGHPAEGTRPLDEGVRALAEEAGLVFRWTGDEGRPAVPPHLRLAFPPEGEDIKALYWCFLPTEQPCPLPLHIHADFLLTDDRSRLQPRSDYNLAVLDRVPALLEEAFRTSLADRSDRWQFLSPQDTRDDPIVERLYRWFLKEAPRIVDLAAEAFGTTSSGPHPQPAEAFGWFWWMIWRWESGASWRGSHKRTRRKKLEERLLGPLRSRGVCCLPVSDTTSPGGFLTGAPLPSPPHRLFRRKSRRPGDESGSRPVPRWLAQRGVEVTWWLPESAEALEDEVGWRDYVWAELVQTVRRTLLPESIGKPFDPTGRPVEFSATEEERRELAEFVVEALGETQVDAAESPGRRLVLWSESGALEPKQRQRATMLKDYAVVPLPVLGGRDRWLPAVRCSTTTAQGLIERAAIADGWGVVDRSRLPDGTSTDLALEQLGVWPSLPLVTSEGGVDWAEPVSEMADETVTALLREVADHRSAYEPALRGLPAPGLSSTAWMPVGGLKRSPLSTWRVRSGDRRDYGTLPVLREEQEAPVRWLWDALGVHPLIDRGDDVDPASLSRKAIASLKWMRGQPEPKTSKARAARRRVASRLAALVEPGDVHAGSRVPVLIEQRGTEQRWTEVPQRAVDEPPAWRVAVQAARWVPKFPELWLVCLDADTRSWPDDGLQKFDPSVAAHSWGDVGPRPDPAMRSRIERCLPELCAVAEVRRYGPDRVFDLDEVIGRWNASKVLRGANVYLQLKQRDGQSVLERTEGLHHDGTNDPILGDVYFTSSPLAASRPSDVLHDVPADRDVLGWNEDDADRYLGRFADWLAQEVFRSRGRGRGRSEFTRILELAGEVMAERPGAVTALARHLESEFGLRRDDVVALRERVLAALLSDSDRAAVGTSIRSVLGRYGQLVSDFDPFAGSLTPACFEPGTIVSADDDEVVARLDGKLEKLGIRFAASFSAVGWNQVRWRETKRTQEQRVLFQVIEQAGLAAWNDDRVVALRARWRRLEPAEDWFHQIGADPWDVLRLEFPGVRDQPTSPDPRLGALLNRRPWKAPTAPPANVQFVTSIRGGPGSHGVVEAQERSGGEKRQRERGENAEVACARQEAERLLPRLLASADLRDALDLERSEVRDARSFDWSEVLQDVEQLARLLRVAGPGGQDCGFDVLSIDEQGTVIRIEVKSTVGNTIHLTENELLRAEQAPERYRLYVYQGFAEAWDLTSRLLERLDDPGLMQARRTLLGDGGSSLEPDGYVLRFSTVPVVGGDA